MQDELARYVEVLRRLRLTHRQLEMLRLRSRGLTLEEIANALRIDVTTVKDHVRSLYERLGMPHEDFSDSARFSELIRYGQALAYIESQELEVSPTGKQEEAAETISEGPDAEMRQQGQTEGGETDETPQRTGKEIEEWLPRPILVTNWWVRFLELLRTLLARTRVPRNVLILLGLPAIIGALIAGIILAFAPESGLSSVSTQGSVPPSAMTQQSAVSSPVPTPTVPPQTPTATPRPSPVPTPTPTAPATPRPTPTIDQQIPQPGSIIPAGQSYSYRDIVVSTHTELRVFLERVSARIIVRNNRSQSYILRFPANIFRIRDDAGRQYPLIYWSSSMERQTFQINISPNGEHIIEFNFSGYVGATDLGYFAGPIPGSVHSIVLTVEDLAGMKNLNWEYDLR